MLARDHIDRRTKYALKRCLVAHGQKAAAGVIQADRPKFGGATIHGIRILQKQYGRKETGVLTPHEMLRIGPFLSGTIGSKAAIALAFFEGDVETVANNVGPVVQAIQDLGTDAAPGNWPYCAAGVAFSLRCAGWKHWKALSETLGDTWVPGMLGLARAGKLGLSVVGWAAQAASKDPFSHLALFQTDRDPALDHIERTTSSVRNGTMWDIGANTGPGVGATLADGDGIWQKMRSVRNATCVRHAS